MCVFRVSGAHFDVDQFLVKSLWIPPAIFRAGEPKFTGGQPNGPVSRKSGFNLNASNAEFSELHKQIDDAIRFLRSNEEELVRLRDFPAAEGMWLDFGISKSVTFPPRVRRFLRNSCSCLGGWESRWYSRSIHRTTRDRFGESSA